MNEPDIADFFGQQFRRELPAGRFKKDFTQSVAAALEPLEGHAAVLTMPVDFSAIREGVDHQLAERGLLS